MGLKKGKARHKIMRILVTGKNSYAGKQFAYRLKSLNISWEVDFISVRDNSWKNTIFSKYKAIYHVAAIVHKKEMASNEREYYQINSELPYEIAKKARNEGVKSFVFLSSIAVYGVIGDIGKKEYITKKTQENPHTLNGKSKLAAEKLLNQLNSPEFKVSILRVPLIYGEGCPGNYSALIKLSKMIPLFPMVENERSMIHVNRLSDIVHYIIDKDLEGTFLVNDHRNVNTSELFYIMRKSRGKSTYLSKGLGSIVLSLGKRNMKIKKLFGNMCYLTNDTYIPGFETNKSDVSEGLQQ